MKHKETWVIVANSSEVRIFRRELNHKLVEVTTLIHPEGRMHASELVSDDAGRTFNRVGNSSHAVSTTVSLKRQQSINFAHEVTDYIETARAADRLDALYIAASPAFLGLLRQGLSSHAQGLIRKELDKDITHVAPEQIWSHFA